MRREMAKLWGGGCLPRNECRFIARVFCGTEGSSAE